MSKLLNYLKVKHMYICLYAIDISHLKITGVWGLFVVLLDCVFTPECAAFRLRLSHSKSLTPCDASALFKCDFFHGCWGQHRLQLHRYSANLRWLVARCASSADSKPFACGNAAVTAESGGSRLWGSVAAAQVTTRDVAAKKTEWKQRGRGGGGWRGGEGNRWRAAVSASSLIFLVMRGTVKPDL